jgi:hypothetical protein
MEVPIGALSTIVSYSKKLVFYLLPPLNQGVDLLLMSLSQQFSLVLINIVPMGSHCHPVVPASSANTIPLGLHHRSSISTTRQSVHDRLIFQRVAAHSASFSEFNP